MSFLAEGIRAAWERVNSSHTEPAVMNTKQKRECQRDRKEPVQRRLVFGVWLLWLPMYTWKVGQESSEDNSLG